MNTIDYVLGRRFLNTANEQHRRRIQWAWWCSLHRDGPIGGTGSVPATMPAPYFCRRSFSGVLLGGGISRKLVGNICPAVTWWLRAPDYSTLPFPFSFRSNSDIRSPSLSAREDATAISAQVWCSLRLLDNYGRASLRLEPDDGYFNYDHLERKR